MGEYEGWSHSTSEEDKKGRASLSYKRRNPSPILFIPKMAFSFFFCKLLCYLLLIEREIVILSSYSGYFSILPYGGSLLIKRILPHKYICQLFYLLLYFYFYYSIFKLSLWISFHNTKKTNIFLNNIDLDINARKYYLRFRHFQICSIWRIWSLMYSKVPYTQVFFSMALTWFLHFKGGCLE